jgi:hypothetical protein
MIVPPRRRRRRRGGRTATVTSVGNIGLTHIKIAYLVSQMYFFIFI